MAVYDAATGKQLAELPTAKAWIRPIEFSPDGKTLAVGYGGYGGNLVPNGFVRLYDVEGLKASGFGHQASGNDDGKHESDAGRPHPGPLPEGEGARANADGKVESDDTPPHPSPLPEGEGVRADADGNPKSQIENPKSEPPATLMLLRELRCNGGPQEPEIAALHWSADGRRLKVLDRAAVYVFDTATGERLAEAPRMDRTPHGQRPANFSPDGRYLAAATTCTRVCDLAELNAAAVSASGHLRGAAPIAGRNDKETRRQGDKGNIDAASNPKPKIENPKLRLVASVVPLGHAQWMVVSADGHWLGTRGAEKEIVYVIQTAAGQETFTPREFYKRFGWKNDPGKVVLPE